MSNDDSTTSTGRDTSDSPESERPADRKREQRSGLSMTQVAASGLAATTSTVALSYFGAAGTIAGAAVGSVVTVVGNDIYARSIRKTAQTVYKIAPVVVPTAGVGRSRLATKPMPRVSSDNNPPPPPPPPHADDIWIDDTRVDDTQVDDTRVDDAQVDDAHRQDERADDGQPLDEQAGADGGASTATRAGPLARLTAKYGRARVLIGASVVLFLAIVAAVLLLELATGKPLSDTVRGRDGSGTTLFQGGGDHAPGGDPTDSPSPTDGSSDDDPARHPSDDESPSEPDEAPEQTPGEVPAPPQEETSPDEDAPSEEEPPSDEQTTPDDEEPPPDEESPPEEDTPPEDEPPPEEEPPPDEEPPPEDDAPPEEDAPPDADTPPEQPESNQNDALG